MFVRQRFKRTVYVLFALFLAVGMYMGVSASAYADDKSGQAFSISPPLIELNANPGDTVEAKIKLTNISSQALTMAAQVNDFGAKNETGEPNIIFDDTPATPYTLKAWVDIPADFVLQSKETTELTVPIHVPGNAEPGGHYAVVRFTGTNTPQSSEQVSLSASVGSLLLLKVAGAITQQASVADFYTANTDFSKMDLFENLPVTFVARVKNEGNIHIKPYGTVTVKDMFGNEVASLPINGDPNNDKDKPGSILPRSVRRFDTALKDKTLFGKYTADMTMTYGDAKKTITASTSFWVVPYKLIVGGLLAAGLLIGGLVWGIKRYNAYIIRKASQPKSRK